MLTTLIEYRTYTQDLSSYDGNVLASLADAQEECERIADRKFEVDTYYPVIDADTINWWEEDAFTSPTPATTLVVGYTTSYIPVGLKRLVAKVANLMLTSSEWENIPRGASSVTVDDISISGGGRGSTRLQLTASDVIDNELHKEIRQWRRGGE